MTLDPLPAKVGIGKLVNIDRCDINSRRLPGALPCVAFGQAIQEVLDEIKRLGGDAGVIVITKDGEITMPYNTDGMKRASVSSTSPLQAITFD